MDVKNHLNKAIAEFMRKPEWHRTSCQEYRDLNKEVKAYIKEKSTPHEIRFDLMGYDICVRNCSFGAVSTIDLFSLFELILFAFYKVKLPGKFVADIGANVGIHTVAMIASGALHVDAYEPDRILNSSDFEANIGRNVDSKTSVSLISAAVSHYNGFSNFTRTLGNTTSSHLSGLKVPHGAQEVFQVPVIDIKDPVKNYSFIKIDAEGAELKIIESIPVRFFHGGLECFIELSGKSHVKELEEVFEKLLEAGVNFFVQENSWEAAHSLGDLPHHWTEGNCFLSCNRPVF